jgi:hypothetical protein
MAKFLFNDLYLHLSGIDWRISAHALTRPRYDFSLAHIPISALPGNKKSMDMCDDDSVIVSAFLKRRK